MKVAIIGSNSFSGSSFVNYLISKKIKVFGFSRSKEIEKIYASYKSINNYEKFFKFIKTDLNNSKDIDRIINIIKKNNIKFIVNFASQGMVAESWITPQDWYQTNVVSSSILINKLQKLKIKKYLNFSTPEVYGNTKGLIKENDFFKPSTPYAVSRSAQDLNLKAYFHTFNFPVVFTRAANVYGPHQQLYRIIPKTIIKSLKKETLELHGGGKSIRSFIHINDVSNALYKILFDKKNTGETYHISTKEFISIKNLVKKIHKILNKKTKVINVDERSGKDLGYFLNSNKLIRRQNWKPIINLDDGIEDTINWVIEEFDQIKNKPLNYIHKR